MKVVEMKLPASECSKCFNLDILNILRQLGFKISHVGIPYIAYMLSSFSASELLLMEPNKIRNHICKQYGINARKLYQVLRSVIPDYSYTPTPKEYIFNHLTSKSKYSICSFAEIVIALSAYLFVNNEHYRVICSKITIMKSQNIH